MELVDAFVTPFSVESQDGGGFGTRCILRAYSVKKFFIRPTDYIVKVLNQILGVLMFPFLHPMFTRYVPLSIFGRENRSIVFNFSQTFAGVLIAKRGMVVCHDLQCHRNFRFNRWARWTEKFLLNKADQVIVVSQRDALIARRMYKVPATKIKDASYILCQNIKPFRRDILGPVRDVLFIGGMDRLENRDAVAWFVDRILSKLPELNFHVVGKTDHEMSSKYPQVKWHGFVEDLDKFVRPFSLMVAPMLSSAGIKIKVIYALEQSIPVLGTREAYSGLQGQSREFCTNKPEDWCNLLIKGGAYKFGLTPVTAG